MSASLVGSEMCIRDSRTPVRNGSRPLPALAAGVQPIGKHDLLLQARAPVSYTHLTLPTICSV
eukprot:4358028-Alexandrium_andersonii.AAC.1